MNPQRKLRGSVCMMAAGQLFLETSALDGYFSSFEHTIVGSKAKVESKPSDLFLSSCQELRAVWLI